MPEATPAKKAAAKPTQKATEAPRSVWDRLAAEFPQADLERLPKPLKARDENKGRCEDTNNGRYYSSDGFYCGGWHARSVHLTYVGHAGITSRLNEVLSPANWEFRPLSLNPEGLPHMKGGEFWGVLTVTDPETGVEASKIDVAANYNGVQEAWGDALRRCAMRFGVGTYLWSKSEAAHAKAQFQEAPPEPTPQADPPSPEPQTQAPPADEPHQAILRERLNTLEPETVAQVQSWWAQQGLRPLNQMDPYEAASVVSHLDEMLGQGPYAPRQDAQDPSGPR